MNFFKKALATVLISFGLLSLSACGDSNESNDSNSALDGMLILQVYGIGEAGGTNSPALSHSFIELYNSTDEEIDLNGSSLHYSSGGSVWNYLALTGKVPGKSSYLITANTYNDYTVKEVTSSDQNWNITIENKGVKVCLLDTTSRLSVVNPFNVNGKQVSGYVDMVVASSSTDTMDAAETNYVSGQSKQKSVRRVNLNDTNDNSKDFTLVDYSTLTSTLLDVYLPKNSSYGVHDPFDGVNHKETNNDILIFQVYGTGNNIDGPINRSFVELYNKSNNDISLDGYSLQYIDEKNQLSKLNLTGTIKANCSFLIVGKEMTTGSTVNITINDSDADMVCDWIIDNKVLTLVLLNSTTTLTSYDAYQDFVNGKLDSFVDMFGSNSDIDLEKKYYYETIPFTELSKQKSARRVSLNDTNNNSIDFNSIDYRLGKDYTLIELENLAPKSTKNGQWKPFI